MHDLRRSVLEYLVACLAPASLAVVCSRLHFNLATSGLLYVIVIVLVARFGSLVSSIVASIAAALSLAYLAPPADSFRVDDPLDYVAIVTFLVTSLIISGLVSKARRQAKDALSSVSYKVIEAEEQERRRIANDLHEGIGQRLTLLALEIEQVKTDTSNPAVNVSNRVDAALKRTLEIATDVKILAHELYSPRMEYLGVAAVMCSFCRDFGKQRNVEINFTSEGLLSPISPDISLCLFRVLQEALQNAVKHSGARRFDARLWGTSDEIHLTVSDCGVGFSPETAMDSGGLGLNRMQERLKLVSGKVSIESQLKQGATIHACVPARSGSHSVRATNRSTGDVPRTVQKLARHR